ncbi:MAG: hypothetical protein JWN43_530 [Gammaproteobacteria bacterium]|nr:hypothetical protein [Gammaproteobacteria bacterium]
MHPSSGISEPRRELPGEPRGETRKFTRSARRTLGALLCAVAIFAAGCHNNNNSSGYGVAWVTLTDDPGDFTSYIVNVDSITLTRSDGAVVTALATIETVDFTKLGNISELWGTATIPTGTYVSATITLDYTNAFVSVMVNGLPVKATVIDPANPTAAVTTQTINVALDPANQLNVVPTYATSAAQRLAIDFNLAASTSSVNLTAATPTVTIKPYLTVGVAPPDYKPIRVRGPLINSSVNQGTYTVYVRPFYDEVDSLGSLTMFVDANTVYTINGTAAAGTAGITQLSQSSAGSTMTAAYTTYEPTPTPSATAGKFHAFNVVAGSTLEDVYTEGLEGDVVARSGNTLTVRGSTLIQNNINVTSYNVADATVTLGPATIVTADGTTMTGLNYNSVAVGQHIIVRGIYTLQNSLVNVDATGASNTNTGSVRLIPTRLYGPLLSSSTGSLLLNLQSINDWPVTDFAFAGNGSSAAANPLAASFSVNTGALALPTAVPGDPLWIDGLLAPFGSAPPDFTASAVNSEATVQKVGATAQTPLTCGPGVLNCTPASMRVSFTSPGTNTPFTSLSGTAMSVNVSDAHFSSGVIRVGAESIPMSTTVNPQIIPTAPLPPVTATAGSTGSVAVTLPPVFLPAYSFGTTGVAPNVISVYSAFATFATNLSTTLATKPALQFEARGTYDRTANTFTAVSVNVVF